MSDLTPKQKRFVEEYLVDANATQAATRAGYSAKTANEQGSRLLANVGVSKAIQLRMDKRSKRVEITADYVLTTIVETIERCKQATPVEEFDHSFKEMVKTGEWKFEHGAVLKGCELLGRHLKLFTDKIEHSGKFTLEDLVADDPKDKK